MKSSDSETLVLIIIAVILLFVIAISQGWIRPT